MRKPGPIVCMGVNTTSGSYLLTVRATQGSPGLVEEGPITQGRSGSIASCFSSWMSMVTGWSLLSSSTRRAPYRLMPSWRPSRV